MPMSGTPIGLPGPPHVPFGGPAGLQKHVMRNHTRVHLPGPTTKMRIDVKQTPGMSYPKPVKRVRINEHTTSAPANFVRPASDRIQEICPVDPGCVLGAPCTAGSDCQVCPQ